MQITLHEVVKAEKEQIVDKDGNQKGHKFIFHDIHGRMTEVAVFEYKQEQEDTSAA